MFYLRCRNESTYSTLKAKRSNYCYLNNPDNSICYFIGLHNRAYR